MIVACFTIRINFVEFMESIKNIIEFSKFSGLKYLLTMKKFKLVEKIENRSLHFQSHPLQYPYKPRLSSMNLPSPMWSKFHRQQDAFNFAKTKKHAKVFSVEMFANKGSGPRSFIVASLEEFWTYYRQLPLSQRHFYEIIPDGSFCHLYFDLEFNKTLNQSSDCENMVSLWIDVINIYLEKEFQIKTVRSNVVELDSTTDTKFSQHLIWHIPNAVFKNNIEVGKFVKMVCQDIKYYIHLKANDHSSAANHWLHGNKASTQVNCLLIKTSSDGKESLFVDEGVYTKNRNFRLFKSTKKGKTAEIQFSTNCCFDLKYVDLQSTCCQYHTPGSKQGAGTCDGHTKEKLIFFSSLVCNVHMHEDMKVLEMPSSYDFTSVQPKKQLYSGNVKRSDMDMKNTDLPPSLLNQLHDFVTQYIKQFNEDAYIYKVSRSGNGIFYDVRGTRYCPTIGREHKSNNVFIVVQLDSQLCYHRCYDHDCRVSATKPDPFPIPSTIVNSKESVLFFSDLFQEVSDSDLMTCVESFEKKFPITK